MFNTCKQKYSAGAHIAEIYDQIETHTEDISLVGHLISSQKDLAIFEPRCGIGRMVIPLAKDGHCLIVLDESERMRGHFRGISR